MTRRLRIDWLTLALGPGEFLIDASPAREQAVMEACARGWRRRRERFMTDWLRESPGRRPWAWWEYEAGEAMPLVIAEETRRLVELDAIDEVERGRIVAAADRGREMYPDNVAAQGQLVSVIVADALLEAEEAVA